MSPEEEIKQFGIKLGVGQVGIASVEEGEDLQLPRRQGFYQAFCSSHGIPSLNKEKKQQKYCLFDV